MLLKEAKQLNKEGMIRYVWIRNREVIVSETDNTPAKKICEMNELLEVSKGVITGSHGREKERVK